MRPAAAPVSAGIAFRAIAAIEAMAGLVAVICLFSIMAIVAADVTMRYAFNRPFGWSYDLIGTYLMVALFYLVVSGAYGVGAHINVDILHGAMPRRARRFADLVTHLVGLGVFLLIAVAGWEATVTAYVDGDRLSGAYAWPTWPALGLVPFGAGLLALRLALHAVAEIAGIVTSKDYIPVADRAHAAGTE